MDIYIWYVWPYSSFHAISHDIQPMPSILPLVQPYALPSQIDFNGHDQGFTVGIDGRVGHLAGRWNSQGVWCDLVGGWNPTHLFLKFDRISLGLGMNKKNIPNQGPRSGPVWF